MKNYESNALKRTCPICGTEFSPRTYHHKYCSKDCAKVAHVEHIKQWQKNNYERIAKNKKIYYKKHKEEYKKSREKYYQKHKEEAKAYGRKYYREHQNEKREYNRNYYRNYYRALNQCIAEHNNCFNCPTKDGECLFN